MSEGEHLMNRTEFNEFCLHMWNELEKHKIEKVPLGNMLPKNVFSISVIDLKRRIAKMVQGDEKEIIKQSVHCANDLFFIWTKMRQEAAEKHGRKARAN